MATMGEILLKTMTRKINLLPFAVGILGEIIISSIGLYLLYSTPTEKYTFLPLLIVGMGVSWGGAWMIIFIIKNR